MAVPSPIYVENLELPPVDARLVAPGDRYEIHDGVLVHVPPADEPHGTQHLTLSALVKAHAGSGFTGACDMLTRTSETSDIAPDVSVFPSARNPETGGRQLEHLAFEVVSTQSLGNAGRKAATLVARGVRRVFAIDVARARVLEWLRGGWRELDASTAIEDPALAVPLPIEPLIHVTKADDAVAHALLARRNPVLEAALAEGKRNGLVEGKQEGLVEGKQEGLVEGKREGLVEGKREGLVEGRQEGLVEGKREGLVEGKRDGLVEGKREGLAEGKREGLAEGTRDGLAEGKRQALLVVLAARSIAVDATARARIVGEPDPRRLDRWIARATSCTSLSEVFAEP